VWIEGALDKSARSGAIPMRDTVNFPPRRSLGTPHAFHPWLQPRF
jgi:hypothetical protein